MNDAGLRANSDLRNEKIGFKIREHTLARVPYILVAGDREIENNVIAVRTMDGKDRGTMSSDKLIALMSEEIKQYGH